MYFSGTTNSTSRIHTKNKSVKAECKDVKFNKLNFIQTDGLNISHLYDVMLRYFFFSTFTELICTDFPSVKCILQLYGIKCCIIKLWL